MKFIKRCLVCRTEIGNKMRWQYLCGKQRCTTIWRDGLVFIKVNWKTTGMNNKCYFVDLNMYRNGRA